MGVLAVDPVVAAGLMASYTLSRANNI